MFNNLKPDLFVQSIYEVPIDFYVENQLQTLFVDLDNTLVGDEDKKRTRQFDTWFEQLKEKQIELVIVSNNRKKERVASFVGDLDLEWYHLAQKQNGRLFKRLLKEKNIFPNQVAVIGDRVTTDIIGGNKIGAFTILTQPITPDKTIGVKCMRAIEKFFQPKMHVNDGDEKNG